MRLLPNVLVFLRTVDLGGTPLISLFLSAVFSPKPQNLSHHQKPDLSVSDIFGSCEPQVGGRDHSQQMLELELQAKTLTSPVPLPWGRGSPT